MTNATADETGLLARSWLHDIDLVQIAEQVGTPVFIYSERQIRRNVRRIQEAARDAGLDGRVKLYVPFFPNSNPHVLRPLQEMGVGLLLQLPGEHDVLTSMGYTDFIVSPGHVSDAEIAFWSHYDYPTFLGSLDEVAFALRSGARSISARIDSLDSGKPGIKYAELEELAALLKRFDRPLECFEVYCGSGNSRDDMVRVIETMFTILLSHFPETRSVNFAGGHGFSYDAWDEEDKHFAWGDYFRSLRSIADAMKVPPDVRFLFEPARDVLADTGALLLGVKRDVISTPVSNIVATDGSRMLMPSAQLRDRNHHVVFLDAAMAELPGPAARQAALRGRTILRHDYLLPGDCPVPAGVDASSHVVVLDVGAYCATQHMEFLNVPPPAEVFVAETGQSFLVTARGGDIDKWRHLLPEPKALG